MLIYWWQSVIIGVLNFIRLWRLKNFTTVGVRVNDRPVQPSSGVQRFIAFFFLAHYGGFHAGYYVFISSMTQGKSAPSDFFYIALCIGIFFVNHLYSFIRNARMDSQKPVNIGHVMMFPYARIFPLHLIIIFGSLIAHGPLEIIAFLLLKTTADLIMHTIKHWDIDRWKSILREAGGLSPDSVNG